MLHNSLTPTARLFRRISLVCVAAHPAAQYSAAPLHFKNTPYVQVATVHTIHTHLSTIDQAFYTHLLKPINESKEANYTHLQGHFV